MGSSPGRHKGSDATEQLMLSFSTEEARSLGAPETALGPQDVDGCWLRRPRQRRDIYPVCGLGATEAKRLQAALALGAGLENSFLLRTTPLGPALRRLA